MNQADIPTFCCTSPHDESESRLRLLPTRACGAFLGKATVWFLGGFGAATPGQWQMVNTENPRILIVDDETDFGAYIGEVAEALGFAVRVTSSGAEFCAAFETFQPTHVSLDMIMPDQDGIELIQWLSRQGKDLKVLLISGYNPQHMEVAALLGQARKLEVVARLQKPVALATLRKALGTGKPAA